MPLLTFIVFAVTAIAAGTVLGRQVRPLRDEVIFVLVVAILSVAFLPMLIAELPALVQAVLAIVVGFGFGFALSARRTKHYFGTRR
jgi:hypothetical protein